jgi:hypothetical protein
MPLTDTRARTLTTGNRAERLVVDTNGDGDKLPSDLYKALHFRISCDISDLRRGHWNGERFDTWQLGGARS